MLKNKTIDIPFAVFLGYILFWTIYLWMNI